MCDIFDQLHMRDIFIFGDHRLCTKSVPPDFLEEGIR